MFFTYILRSLKDNSFYIGSAKDLNKRLAKHNKGLVKSTKHHSPFEIVYYEKFNTLSEVRKRESQIKNWKKRKAIENLIRKSDIPNLPR